MTRPAVSVVVPFRAGDPWRDRAWQYVRAWYGEQHPQYEIVVADAPGEWSKGAAVAAAERRARGAVLVVTDADLFIGRDELERAILAVVCGATWVQPHGDVHRLTEHSTTRLYDGTLALPPRWLPRRALDRRPFDGPRGGGIVVCWRGAYRASGGIDPRFIGFGGDDISWARALDTLAGPGLRFHAPLWHLWHERAPRYPGDRGSPANERLAGRYVDATGDLDAMRSIVEEHTCLTR